MSPRAKTANSVRVMTWNVLADGLSADDFLLNDVLEGEEDKLDVGAQIAALAAVREGPPRVASGRRNHRRDG